MWLSLEVEGTRLLIMHVGLSKLRCLRHWAYRDGPRELNGLTSFEIFCCTGTQCARCEKQSCLDAEFCL